jgi:hypothetical protein
MRWTTLWKERDQAVLDFTNTFHTLCTKRGIKDSERHLVLKYHGALHRYIQNEMDFLYISSLGATYRYVVKMEKKFKHQNKRDFGAAYQYAVKIEQKFKHQKKLDFEYSNLQQPNYDKDGPNKQSPKN